MHTSGRPLLNPDEIRRLPGDISIIMGRFPPILSRRIVYHEDWWFLQKARADPKHPVTEDVRSRAFERRLKDAGSVAGCSTSRDTRSRSSGAGDMKCAQRTGRRKASALTATTISGNGLMGKS